MSNLTQTQPMSAFSFTQTNHTWALPKQTKPRPKSQSPWPILLSPPLAVVNTNFGRFSPLRSSSFLFVCHCVCVAVLHLCLDIFFVLIFWAQVILLPLKLFRFVHLSFNLFFFFVFVSPNVTYTKKETLRGNLVCVFKQLFLVFKQHFTYFYILFHSHIFPQMFSNNNFQFLNTCTKRALSLLSFFLFSFLFLGKILNIFQCSSH